MRSWTICISAGNSTGSWLQSVANDLHYLFNINDLDFWETNNIDFLFMILSAVD